MGSGALVLVWSHLSCEAQSTSICILPSGNNKKRTLRELPDAITFDSFVRSTRIVCRSLTTFRGPCAANCRTRFGTTDSPKNASFPEFRGFSILLKKNKIWIYFLKWYYNDEKKPRSLQDPRSPVAGPIMSSNADRKMPKEVQHEDFPGGHPS